MTRPAATDCVAAAVRVIEGILAEGLAPAAAEDLVGTIALLEEAIDELGGVPASPAAALFAPMRWLP
jgi:hypothetical protein